MKSIRVLSLATLALPMALAAQQPAAAPAQPPADPITTVFKNAGARNARLLSTAFDSIPAAKYSFKPTPAQLSIANVASHLEAANYQLCGLFGTVKQTLTAKDSTADSLKAMWPKDTLVARLKASFVFCDNAMATVTDAKLSDQLPAGPPGSGRTVVRAQYVFIYVADLVDHYSQIANYMRLNGLLPPSAYPRPGRGGE
jgi:DinB superfamily